MLLNRGFAATALVLASAAPASAHHVMGGMSPSTLFEGLLSGLAHPVIEMDHLAFVIALGLAAAFTSDGLRLVGLFVVDVLRKVVGLEKVAVEILRGLGSGALVGRTHEQVPLSLIHIYERTRPY